MFTPEALLVSFVFPLVLVAAERLLGPRRRGWLTPHMLGDACLGLLRLAFFGGLLGGFVVAARCFIDTYLPWMNLRLLDGQPAWVQLVVYFLATDLTFYAWHRLMHSNRPLWLFHAVHHAQRQANPMLQNRAHPVEEVFYVTARLVPACVLGGGYAVSFWFTALDTLWSHFLHSDVRVNLGPLKYVLVSPQYHRVHHSAEPRHFDKNFAGRLILWDYLFGTLHPRFDEYPPIGVAGYPVVEESFAPWRVVGYALGHLAYPFRALWSDLFPRPPEAARDRAHADTHA
jgi:sterol desaturase/sphingolipid hydroxylase (fatty acid hydroxylase superfamily)